MYTTGGLSTGTTESPPQAQQGFAEPTLDPYVEVLSLTLLHQLTCRAKRLFQDEFGEPRNHSRERPSTVESLVVLDLAESSSPTYRIPVCGTEGCFNRFSHIFHTVKFYTEQNL